MGWLLAGGTCEEGEGVSDRAAYTGFLSLGREGKRGEESVIGALGEGK